MLRVTIELVSAQTGKTSPLLYATICNDGSGSPSRGNYIAHFGRKGGGGARSARVEDFPRLTKNAWHLLARSLRAAGYK